MAYRAKRDPESVMRLRTILSHDELAGDEAWAMDDEEVVRAAEIFMGTFTGAVTKIHLEMRPVYKDLATRLRRYGVRLRNWRETPWDALMREAE